MTLWTRTLTVRTQTLSLRTQTLSLRTQTLSLLFHYERLFLNSLASAHDLFPYKWPLDRLPTMSLGSISLRSVMPARPSPVHNARETMLRMFRYFLLLISAKFGQRGCAMCSTSPKHQHRSLCKGSLPLAGAM